MIGAKIKALRMQKGYSITKLANKAQISKSYLSYLEKQSKIKPSLHIISKIASSLDTTTDYFLEESKTASDVGVNEEWIRLLKTGLDEGMTKEEFLEFQSYLKYRRSL
ncbi:helix-turn-helix transcriptional regulator [Bacillus sp. B190/17]|uniref:Helix-turn-helix transcriptional regulator n=1 Tax=Bacillus lumedeiriae TaxID=3058829 RepID=A0ABW8IAB5_9BACI